MKVNDRRESPIFIHHELDDADLDPYAFRIYCRIARRVGSKGDECEESVPNMAKGCGMTTKRARKALKELEGRGMIERNQRPGYTTEVTLLPRPRWNQGTPENDPPQKRGGTPGEIGGTPPAKSQDEDTPFKDTPSQESGAHTREEESDAGESGEDTVTIEGDEVPLSRLDRATGKTFAALGEKERVQAHKGWPLGVGITEAKEHPAVQEYPERFPHYDLRAIQAEKIAFEITKAVNEEVDRGKQRGEACDVVLGRWRDALDFWALNDYKASSVGRMLTHFGEITDEARSQASAKRSNGRARAQQPHTSGSGKRGRAV